MRTQAQTAAYGVARVACLAAIAVGHATAAHAQAPAGSSRPATACFPPCRSGYTCIGGRCVSACNPPCADAEECTSAGECVGRGTSSRPASPPTPTPPEAAPPSSSAASPLVAPPPTATSPSPSPPAASGAPSSPAPAPQATGGTPPPDGQSTGDDWALGAAIAGFISAGGVLGLAEASEFTRANEIPSIPLGAAATVMLGAMGPVVFAGGASARRRPGAHGVVGLRVAGWIGYGVTLTDAVYLIVTGVGGIVPPPGVITIAGVSGALGLTAFAIDALVSHNSAADAEPAPRSASGIKWTPLLLPLAPTNGNRGTGLSLGVAARF